MRRRRKSQPCGLLQLAGKQTPGGGGRGGRPTAGRRRRGLVRGCRGGGGGRSLDLGLFERLQFLDPFEALPFGLFLLFLLALYLLLLLPELLRGTVKVGQFGVPLVVCPESRYSRFLPCVKNMVVRLVHVTYPTILVHCSPVNRPAVLSAKNWQKSKCAFMF